MCFFFSSRRRHTRCGRDWSSDVCSSDLLRRLLIAFQHGLRQLGIDGHTYLFTLVVVVNNWLDVQVQARARSEERRVGKECRSGRWRCPQKKKECSSVDGMTDKSILLVHE